MKGAAAYNPSVRVKRHKGPQEGDQEGEHPSKELHFAGTQSLAHVLHSLKDMLTPHYVVVRLSSSVCLLDVQINPAASGPLQYGQALTIIYIL